MHPCVWFCALKRYGVQRTNMVYYSHDKSFTVYADDGERHTTPTSQESRPRWWDFTKEMMNKMISYNLANGQYVSGVFFPGL